MLYTHLFDRATWQFFANLGMNLDYFEKQGAGAFALEQHTRYLTELLLGQEVTVRTRAIDRSAKRFHFMHFMTIGGNGVPAATTELIGALFFEIVQVHPQVGEKLPRGPVEQVGVPHDIHVLHFI